MHPFFKDDDFDFMMMTAIGATYYRAADVGECMMTAAHIRNGKYDSWVDAWAATAERVKRIADECAKAGRQVSASEAYLRASTYFGAAMFFADGSPRPVTADLTMGAASCLLGRRGAALRPAGRADRDSL